MANVIILNQNIVLTKFAMRKPLNALKPGTVYDAVRIEIRNNYPGIKISRTPSWNQNANQWEGECSLNGAVIPWIVR
jgi:hypothetical protein